MIDAPPIWRFFPHAALVLLLCGCLPDAGPRLGRPALAGDDATHRDSEPTEASPPSGTDARSQTSDAPRTDDAAAAPITDASTGSEIEFEAENAMLSAPMVVVDFPMASGGKGIGTPADAPRNPNDPTGGGSALLSFDVPPGAADQTFHVWLRAQAPDGGSDSFHVAMDAGAADTFDLTPNDGKLYWMRLNGNNGQIKDRTFTLAAGPHVLKINHREPQAFIDKIVLSPRSDFTPQ